MAGHIHVYNMSRLISFYSQVTLSLKIRNNPSPGWWYWQVTANWLMTRKFEQNTLQAVWFCPFILHEEYMQEDSCLYTSHNYHFLQFLGWHWSNAEMAPPGGVQVPLEVRLSAGHGGAAGGQYSAHVLQMAHVHRLEWEHSKTSAHEITCAHKVFIYLFISSSDKCKSLWIK